MIYKTATGSSPGALDEQVNALFKEGFELYGNPYLSDEKDLGFDHLILMCQPMIKREAGDSE